MKINKIYNFVLLAIFAGLFLTASAQAATLTVNSTADPGDGTCDVTECTLREAINAANPGDTIEFSALFDTAQMITLSDAGSALSINKNLTITGKGSSLTTVRRNPATTGNFRIFETGGGATVGISGLTVTGARVTNNNGGGIFVDGSSVLTLTGVVVTDNYGSSGGGILIIAGSTLNLIGSTVSNNNTLVAGGSLGGGIFSIGTLNVNNSTISGNSAANGGGIRIESGTATITGSTVSNNTATSSGGRSAGGGGIDNNATLTVNSSIISNNSADSSAGGFGGGIRVNAGMVVIINTTLNGNTATDGAGINCSGTVNISASTLSNNIATGNNNTAGGIDSAGNLNITNSTFSGNRSNGTGGTNGGAIWNNSATTLNNVTITDNFAAGPNSASGIIRVSGTINLKNTIIAANQNNAATPDVTGTSFVSNGYNLIGNVGTVTTFNQTGDQTGTFAAPLDPRLAPLGNYGGPTQTHQLLSGSPAIDKGALATDPITNTIITTDQRGLTRPVDDPLITNAPAGNGSDIGAFEVQTIRTNIVNSTNDPGDGICNVAECTLREAITDANAFSENDVINFDASLAGQTITLNGTQLTIANSGTLTINGLGASQLTVSGNNASRVLFIQQNANVTIDGITITDGFLVSTPGIDGSGGGIINDRGTLTLTNSTVSGNTVGDVGGGISNNEGTIMLSNSTFSNNSARFGGGIFTSSGTATMTNLIISSNTATQSGGAGIYNDGLATLSNSTVINNTANGSGGGGGIRNTTTLTINTSAVNNNSASSGGGISSSGTVNLNNSTISFNTVTGSGAGLLIFGTAAVNNSTVNNNMTSGGSGGGIFNSNSAVITLTNSTVSNNSASLNGGGVFNFGGTLNNLGGGPPPSPGTINLNSTTISNNSANNGGGIASGGTANLNNTIIANNTSGGDCISGGGTINASYSLIEQNLTCVNGTSSNNLTGDPNLGPLQNNGGPTFTHALLPGSIAIDAGSNALVPLGITTDQRGQNRIVDGDGNGSMIVDMGSFEALAPSAANVSISGRVFSSAERGRGVSNATVHMTDQDGNVRTVRTNMFGYFRFTNIEVGQTLILNVFSKQYQFDAQIVNVDGVIENLNFTPQNDLTNRK